MTHRVRNSDEIEQSMLMVYCIAPVISSDFFDIDSKKTPPTSKAFRSYVLTKKCKRRFALHPLLISHWVVVPG
jgi:hypothetical protein